MPTDNHVIPQLLYLASQSPRRRMMIGWLGLPISTTRADIDETPLLGEIPAHLAPRLARTKAQAAVAAQPGTLVLTADTVVDLECESLGKPGNAAEARAMLRRLRQCRHQVHTGIALTSPQGHTRTRCVTTDVTMRPYTDAEIDAYVATGDPMDKAGAYAIQHQEFHPVDQVQVCYANVVGLPLCAVIKLLNEVGWSVNVNVPALCYLHLGYRCPAADQGIEV